MAFRFRDWKLGIGNKRNDVLCNCMCICIYIYMNEKYKGYNSIMGQKDERPKSKVEIVRERKREKILVSS